MFRVGHCSRRFARLVCSAQTGRPRPSPGNDPRLQGKSGPASGDEQQQSMQQPPEVKVVKLEDADVEGVAKIDADAGWQSAASRVQLLVTGDSVFILLFAAIGRINHGEILDVELLITALPFWTGWFSTGPFLGAYGKSAQDGYARPAALVAAKTWAVATPLSLALRGLMKGYVPPTPFIIVSFVTTGALLIGWRTALAMATKPEDKLTPLERFQRNKSKKGNAAEFMQLLSSLTKRW